MHGKDATASRETGPHTDLQRRTTPAGDRQRRRPTQPQPNGDPPQLTLWGEE